jgi:hypothetical protein
MRQNLGRWADGFAAFLIVAASCVAVVPLWPSFPAADLDSAWKFAVNIAVAQHKVFGRDLIFTFGPYADVYTATYDPATDGLAMVATTIMAAALAAGLIVLTQGAWRWLAVLLSIGLSYFLLRDPLFLLMPMLFLAIAASPRQLGRAAAFVLVMLAATMAILVLVKGTFGAASAVGLAGGGITLLVRRRWVVAMAIVIAVPVTLAGAWVLAHQPLSALPDFFRGQSEIIDGYTDAMSLAGPSWELADYVVAATLVLLLNVPAFWRARFRGAVLASATAALVLLAFKAGFVRQDGHVVIAAGSLAMFASVLAFLHRGALPSLGLAAALACALSIDYGAEQVGPRAALLRVATMYEAAAYGMQDRLLHGPARKDAYADALEKLRVSYPLPELSGTADIYSFGQSILLAHGIPWAPRPVVQSYSAFSPTLAEANARHLEGMFAPDNVLLRLEPIDDRLPSLEDGPSWLPLLARYEVTAMLGQTALLHRLPGAPDRDLLGQRTGPDRHVLNEAVPIQPGAGPLWAWVDVTPTAWGRVASAVFKPPSLGITITLNSGRSKTFRFVSGMGRAGFMLAPLVVDAAQLMAMEIPESHGWADSVPVSFTLTGDPAYWSTSYSVTTAPVNLPKWQGAQDRVFSAPKPTLVSDNTDARCWLDTADGVDVDHLKPFRPAGLVRLTGWVYGATGYGVEPQSVSLTLRAADGATFAIPATLQYYRADVAAFFHQPQLSLIGFQVLADFQALHGSYQLGAQATAGGHSWNCTLIEMRAPAGG